MEHASRESRVALPPKVSMGTNPTGKRFYQVKVKGLDTTSIKELGRLMEPLQMQAFRKTYGKILELTIAEVSIEAIASLTQYYDQPLRCFTFGDFQLVPTIEEFEEILGCPLGGRKPYLSSGCLPSLSRIATVVKDSARGLDRIKQTRNGIPGLPRKYLEDKARGMANQGDWVPFMDVLALLIFGVVLFPNVDGLVDLAAIDAFLAYHHSKESPVVAVLADLFDTFNRRCEKSSARIICCLPALCVWLVSHLFQQDMRHPCPLLSHRSCTEKRRIDWDQLLAGIGGRTINWFPRWKEGKEGVLFSCGGYPNIPLIGTRGCINYNPALAIRQLGYPMRGAPMEESMSHFLVRDFGAQNFKAIQRIHKAWETPLRKDQELRGIRNGIIGGYHEWLKVHIRGKAKLAKEKFKLAATHIRKECAGLREENATTARALEQEAKRARKEEYGRNKFRGALWGSNNELKLRREERDQSRAHSMVLKEELVACSRSKRSLSQRLCETETNMLAIIAKYQEELGLATAHEHRVADEYAQVYAEKEARGRVIDSLHQEATMWMDRFALTLNGSQEFPRLLAQAKAMADTYPAPEEIHGLLCYWKNTITKRATRHPYRTRSKSRTMGDQEETREQMKADMSALKEQMASMMEAMLGMRQLMEKNMATAAAVSSAAEANPTLLATAHHPPSNIVGRGRDTLGHDGNPHLGYNRAAYPYGLSPNYSPPVLQDDAGHIASPVLERDPPQQPDEVHKDPQDYARRDVESKPLRDVATPRRFIFEALEKGGVIPHSGRKEDSCLLHSGELHDMETCLGVEELLQQMIDQGRLEVSSEGREEQHICMQSTDGSGVARPKPLVIYFTKGTTSQKPGHPLAAKPVPFPYQNSHAVPWRYTPPREKEEEATDVSSFSAKVTNITGLSGVTRSGRVFAPLDLPVQPANVKGKGKVVEEQDDEAPLASNKDIPVKGLPEKRDGKKEVSLEEATVMMARVMLGNGYEPGMGLAKDSGGITSLINVKGNRGKYGLGYKPTQADIKRSIAGRKNGSQSSRLRQEGEGSPPYHISRSFISAGLGDEGQVVAIYEDDVPSTLDLVRPCPPDFQLGNWRVEERPDIYAMSIISDDESPEGTNTWDPPINFEQETNQTEDEGNEDGQDHLELPSGVGTKHEHQKPIKVRQRRGQDWSYLVVYYLQEMAPRKLASKRSRKDKAAEGTSSAPEYDSHRFRSAVHQQRFEAIKGWSFLWERRVQLRDDEYTDFQEEIGRWWWASLVTPMAKFDPDIVLEFYANAWPTEEGVRDMRSWVRGQWIPFDADAIGQLLGYPLVLEEGQECEYGQRRNRSDGFDEEAITQLLCIPGNILPTDHNSDLPLPKCQLLYAILTRMSIHVDQLIADAIYIFAGMAPTRHPLDPDKSNRALGFPALITGLCQSFGVPVTPTKRQAQGDAPQAAGAPPPPHQVGPAGSFDMEQYLRHLVCQQAANHRAHVQTHDCLYQLSLSMQSQGFASFSCPTPNQFRAEVAWPRDWSEAQAGEAPPEAPGDGEEAHEDEEMADLLDFLGGSGAT
ncbi:hypothetical protein GmHk_16G046413 [Glycine max]|nr:hypothetical protein GmHk_16G046413 [Glycine max]